MSRVSAETTPKQRAGVLVQQVKPDDPTLVLLDPKSGEYYTLEEVAMRVWQLCDGTRSAGDIAKLLSDEYSESAENIERDVVELLQELVDETLVVAAS